MKKQLLISAGLTILLFFSQNSFAQSTRNRCSTTEYREQMLKKDPEIAMRRAQIEQDMQEWLLNNAKNPQPQAVVYVPVVVHVLWNTTAQDIPDQYIQAQIDQLNLDYSKANTDWATGTPAVFQPTSANCEIQFCLAIKDPAGATTTGIIHKQTTVTQFSSNDDVKFSAQGGDDGWPSTQYLNIWICSLTAPILGYATPPGGASNLDGVVLHYTTLPGPPNDPNYNLGRTATHEVGHWLNLEHINGDATCGNDLIGDTPLQDALHYGVQTHPLHVGNCSGTTNGEMFMNYMDYGDDVAIVMFTTGQKNRMKSCLNTTRSGIGPASLTKCVADLSVHSMLSSNNLTVFPNPSSGNFSLSLSIPNISNADLIIRNAVGETILSQKVSFDSGNTIEVKTDNIPDGIYFIELETSEGVVAKKVVLHR